MKTFEELVKGFIEYMRLKNMSKATISSYRDSANAFIRFLIANNTNDFRDITKETIKDYQKYLMEHNRQKRLCLETVHLMLRGLKRFFEFLKAKHYVLYDSSEAIIYPKLGNRLPNDILTRDEVDKLLALPDINASAGIRDRALLETLYSTGIRLQECTNLEVSDVDYDGGYLRVNQGKGNKDRIVPLGKIACYWLKEYIRRVRPEFLKHNKKDPEHNALWVSHYLGKPLSSQIIAKLVRSYGRKAGINKKVTVHTWRRTLATHLLQAGVNLVYIQEILGHEDMRSLDRYIKVTAIEVKQTHQRTHPRERIAAYEEKKQG